MKTTEEMIEVACEAYWPNWHSGTNAAGKTVAREAMRRAFEAAGFLAPKPELTQDTIPWDAIDAQWQKSARNEDGNIILFANSGRPAPGGCGWQTSGPWLVATGLIAVIPGTVDWRESLQERPAAEEKRP